MRMFLFIAVLVMPCLAFLLAVAHPSLAAERPNIVFIYTDDQAPTAVGIENVMLFET